MRLIDADALKKEWSLGDKCEECPQNAWKCQFEQNLTQMDICQMIDEAPTVSGWVSVKDRMPEPEENVIIWAKTGCMKYAQYHEDGSVNPWYVYEDNARAWTNVISHWMPLPEPPEEDEKHGR